MLYPLACKLLCVLCWPLHCLAGWHVCTALSALFYALAIAYDVSIVFHCILLCKSVVCLFDEIGWLDASAAGPGFACRGHAGYLALFLLPS